MPSNRISRVIVCICATGVLVLVPALTTAAPPASAPPFSAPLVPPFSTRLFHALSAPANHPAAEVRVPAGFKVIGCGARVNYVGNGNMLTALFPTDSNTCFAASKDHQNPDVATLDVWAIALSDPDDQWDVRIFRKSSAVLPHPVAAVAVAPGYVMVGGGAQIDYGGNGNMLTASFPSAQNIWQARGKDHLVSDPAAITVFAVGIRPRDPKLPLPRAVIVPMATPPFAHPVGESRIDASRIALTCGGALDDWHGAGNLLTASYPSPNLTTWLAAGKDHNASDPAALSVYAVGIVYR